MLHFLRYGATMPTMAPPEDALSERLSRLDGRFDRVDEQIVAVDKRVSETAKKTDRRITEGREDMHRGFDVLGTEMRALRKDMSTLQLAFNRGNFTLLASMLGLIAAILAKGG
jgi:hypothetical protein